MTAHPINTTYVDGSNVAKSDVRGYEKVRNRVKMASASEVRSTDLSLQTAGIDIAGAYYELDTSDTTTADDGVECIIDSAGNRFINADLISALEFVFAGVGSTLSAASEPEFWLEIPFDCSIIRWTLAGDTSGTAALDLWVATYAAYLAAAPTSANSIVSAAPPTVTAARAAQSSTLTGWTTSLAIGSMIGAKLTSISSFTKLTLSLKVRARR